MQQLIRRAVVSVLCLVYSIVVAFNLLVIYVTKFSSQPWKPKDRPKAPACLTDPKYGTHKFAKVNGVQLHYVEAGDPTKPLMLFVHGFPEFWYSWRHQITEFSKDFWVVAIDMRGYNFSEKPSGLSNYKVMNMVEDIRALIEHLNRKQCILVCHDWGAIIGWDFVAKYKFMVQKYIMMGAPPGHIFAKLVQQTKEQFRRSWYMIFFQMPVLPELAFIASDFAMLTAIWNNEDGTAGLTEEDCEAYKYTFQKPGNMTASINYYRANLGEMAPDTDTTDGSDGMFVLGEKERYISMDSLALTAKRYPKIRVETVPNANHFLQQDNFKGTNELIRSFIGPASSFSIENFS